MEHQQRRHRGVLMRELAALAVAAGALPAAGPALAEESQRFQDWQLRCQDQGPPEDQGCWIRQEHLDQSGTKILEIAVLLRDGQPHLALLVPPQIDRERPVGFRIEGHPEIEARVDNCTQAYCLVVGAMGPEVLEALKA